MHIKFRITRYNESRLQRVKKCKGKYSFKAGVHCHQTFQQCRRESTRCKWVFLVTELVTSGSTQCKYAVEDNFSDSS